MIPSPNDIENLWKYGKEGFRLYLTMRRLLYQCRARRAQRGFAAPLLYNYLKWRYPKYKLFSSHGFEYPIVYFPCSEKQVNDPNCVLVKPLIEGESSQYVTYDRNIYTMLVQLIDSKKPDTPTYILDTLTLEPLQLSCRIGYYSANLATSHTLEWELLSQVAKNPHYSPEELDEMLPLRRALHSNVADPVISGEGRAAGVAVSTLLICRHNEQYRFWLKVRGKTSIPINLGQLHVIPAGFFQASMGEVEDEYSVAHNFKREYLEELFNRPDPEGTEAVYNYFYREPPIKYLHQLFENGLANLYLLGIAVDLLNLRPEVCTTLVISTPEWLDTHGAKATDTRMQFSINSEFLNKPSLDFAQTLPYPFSQQRTAKLGPAQIAPPAAVALWSGLELFEKKIKASGGKFA